MEVEDEVDILMSTDILAAQMSTKSINFVRAQSGWIFRADKTVRARSLRGVLHLIKLFLGNGGWSIRMRIIRHQRSRAGV